MSYYFFVALILITAGSLTKDPDIAQFFILPIGIVAVLFQKILHKGRVRDLGFRGCSLKHAAQAVALPIGIILSVSFLDYGLGIVKIAPLSEITQPFTGQAGTSPGGFLLVLLAGALLTFAGVFISEELGFRGYLMTRLAGHGGFKALLFSSTLFGVWHIPSSLILLGSGMRGTVIYAVNIFLLGIVFGYLFLASGSLVPSSLCHGVWNALEYGLFGYGKDKNLVFGSAGRASFFVAICPSAHPQGV
ncbi:MAG: type II CAAX endopeptidase family protein [Candidatus Aminicenantales bacterium]